MKQLIVTGKFPSASETFVVHEVAAIRKHGVNSLVLADGYGDKAGATLLQQLGIPLQDVFYASWRKSPTLSLDLCRFRRSISSAADSKTYGYVLGEKRKTFFSHILKCSEINNVEIVHAHFVQWAFEVGLPLSQILGVPLTLVAHDGHLADYPDENLRILQEHASQIIVVSEAWYKLWREKTGSSRKLVVIPNSVNTQEFKRKHLSPRNFMKIICISRLVKNKKVQDLLYAAQQLIDKKYIFYIDIIGDGPERESLEMLCKELGIFNIVKFHGFLPHSDVRDMLSSSDIFVHPSCNESFGIVVLEAMASSLPVVVSDYDAAKEIINSGINGLLYKTGSVNELVSKLEILFSDEAKRRALAEAAVETVQDRYDRDRRVDKLMSIWSEILVR